MTFHEIDKKKIKIITHKVEKRWKWNEKKRRGRKVERLFKI